MDTRSYLRSPARLSPLAFGLALAFGSAVASPHGDALHGTDLDAAIPRWLSPVDKVVFRKQLERLAAHRPADVPITAIPVSNCDDSGAGSLRDAVNSAVSGDTIDLTALDCSTITLTSGAIVVPADRLTIQGPGALALTIDGGYNDRVFWHLGFGELAIADVSMAHGRKYLNEGDNGAAAGGCVFSTGDVTLDHAWAKYCKVGSNDSSVAARGGAIYGENGVFLNGSIVTGSTAYTAGSAYDSRGGGIYTPGDLLVLYGIVSGNTATTTGGGIQVGSTRGTAGGYARIKYSTITENTQRTTGYVQGGGGLYLTGDAYISHSTISGNSACRGAGVYFVNAGNATGPAGIYSSTVSGNSGSYCGVNSGAGGVHSMNANMVIMDSTIAFNTYDDNRTDNKYGAGVRMRSANTLVLQNTIIAGNMVRNFTSPDFLPDDIGGHEGASVVGANNLVYLTDILLPPGTILLTDPSLRALSANGGTTATHMPNFGSPVIDFGNNVSGAEEDQRGQGYPRILGAGPDIGAVEFDLADGIFANGFD